MQVWSAGKEITNKEEASKEMAGEGSPSSIYRKLQVRK